MHTDSDIAAGQAARGIGRYDLAVAAFQRAAARADIAAEARRLEFGALREVDVSRHLIGRLLRRIGMPGSAYKGFAAIDPPLDGAMVGRRLDALAADAGAPGDRLGPARAADLLARDEAGSSTLAGDEMSRDQGVRIALARCDLRRGRPLDVLIHLDHPQGSEAPSAAGKTILGKALWQLGNGHVATNAFNLSLLYLGGTVAHGNLQFQAAYKDYRIVFYRGQFYAIPDWRDPVLDDSGGEARLVAHRLPRWLRDGIRHRLPAPLFALLRRIFATAPLRGEVRLEQMPHSPDLVSVLRAVDHLHPAKH